MKMAQKRYYQRSPSKHLSKKRINTKLSKRKLVKIVSRLPGPSANETLFPVDWRMVLKESAK